ncbi:MAG: hypothetical protein LQ349_001133 [Xanthoria aureola]|nr:MAG: hypothetical protein LQ349_001133 [Xanthoria aureola]
MPFIISPDGRGTSNRKPTYSDAAKGLLRGPQRHDQSSTGRNEPPSEERAATSTAQHLHPDVPRTPKQMESTHCPPQGYVESRQGSPSCSDPELTWHYHHTTMSRSLHGPPPTSPIGRAFPHHRPLGATLGPETMASVQRTPNPLQMTSNQSPRIPNFQVSQNYGQGSQRTVQDGYDKVTSGAQRPNAGRDLAKREKPEEDRYDVLMNQYTERWYDCDLDHARSLPKVEAPKEESDLSGLKP